MAAAAGTFTAAAGAATSAANATKLLPPPQPLQTPQGCRRHMAAAAERLPTINMLELVLNNFKLV